MHSTHARHEHASIEDKRVCNAKRMQGIKSSDALLLLDSVCTIREIPPKTIHKQFTISTQKNHARMYDTHARMHIENSPEKKCCVVF